MLSVDVTEKRKAIKTLLWAKYAESWYSVCLAFIYDESISLRWDNDEKNTQICPISTAATHIGSSCACSDGQSRFGRWSRPIKSNSGQPPQTNHTTVSRYRHCGGVVVIHSINGHRVLHYVITQLLSLSQIRPPLRAITHGDDAKGWWYFWEVLRCFTI